MRELVSSAAFWPEDGEDGAIRDFVKVLAKNGTIPPCFFMGTEGVASATRFLFEKRFMIAPDTVEGLLLSGGFTAGSCEGVFISAVRAGPASAVGSSASGSHEHAPQLQYASIEGHATRTHTRTHARARAHFNQRAHTQTNRVHRHIGVVWIRTHTLTHTQAHTLTRTQAQARMQAQA
jgi:hypothetical protein